MAPCFSNVKSPVRRERITRRMSQGIKKTVRPVLMSKEEFFTKVIKVSGNANI